MVTPRLAFELDDLRLGRAGDPYLKLAVLRRDGLPIDQQDGVEQVDGVAIGPELGALGIADATEEMRGGIVR